MVLFILMVIYLIIYREYCDECGGITIVANICNI